jgi:hypothetical protein
MRPTWMPGNMSAQMTAKMVIASAKRLIARAPLLAEEEEDGADERSGVADAHPEHEVDDRPAPADGVGDTPDAGAFPDQPRDDGAEHGEHRRGERKGSKPAGSGRFFDDLADLVGDGCKIVLPLHERRGEDSIGTLGLR